MTKKRCRWFNSTWLAAILVHEPCVAPASSNDTSSMSFSAMALIGRSMQDMALTVVLARARHRGHEMSVAMDDQLWKKFLARLYLSQRGAITSCIGSTRAYSHPAIMTNTVVSSKHSPTHSM